MLWPLLLFGCALGGPVLQNPSPATVPPQAHLEKVPFFPQKAYQCGPAALAMVMRWNGVQVQPDDLVPLVYLPDRRGSLQTGLISASRRFGLLAYPLEGEDCLLRELAAGHPVIVLQNLGLSWLAKWHYAVVIGYDLSRQEIVLHSGQEADRKVRYATFARTWRRAESWGLLVLPAGRMPACTKQLPYLKAVLGIEQSGHPVESLAAIRTADRHWPNSPQVKIALGNALYASKDLPGAVQAFSDATRLAPDNGAAFNNLAHVLIELEQFDEAEKAARTAVALGGPYGDIFQQTLDEILKRRTLHKAD